MPYAISDHAMTRIAARGLDAEQLAAALAGRAYPQHNGNVLYRDPRSRCAVVVDPRSERVVTAYRLTKRQMKQRYSR